MAPTHVGAGMTGTTAAVTRPRDRDELAGRVALVSGGSRGLGLLIARELAARGARVAVCARDRAELDRAEADLTGRAAEVLALQCDVTDRSQIARMLGEVTERLGNVDVLVNVAGVIQVGPAATMSEADYVHAMDTMFWAPVHLTRSVLPSMTERGYGRIATVTSIGGKISVPHLLPYSCAKFAAVAFSEGLRAELAGTGVKVTTVVPGLMRTGSHLRAEFGGDQVREYAWFALGASMPLVSMDAERAARHIVQAIRRGRRELVLTPLGKVAVRVHGVAPASTTALLEVMARLLPGVPAPAGTAEGTGLTDTGLTDTGLIPGRTAEARLDSPLLRRLTALGSRASRRFNQL
jgi:short-subunit dehydrogenase